MRLLLVASAFLALLSLNACHDDTALSGGSDLGDHLNDASVGAACKTITDEATCRARTDCVADTCNGCSCTPSFTACRATSAPKTPCPQPPCPFFQCCHANADCSSGPAGSTCAVPPVPLACGPCNLTASNCATDSDCTPKMPGSICAPTPCACASALTCQMGCASNADCAETETCGGDHRCKPRPCDAACTGNYRCATDGVTCERKPCVSKDSECGSPGYCIEKQCSKFVGQCVLNGI